MRKLLFVFFALFLVLVGCDERSDSPADKERREIADEDFMKFKNTHTLGVGAFSGVTTFGSDLLAVSDLASATDDDRWVVEKLDSEGNSTILFQAPPAKDGQEYGFDSLRVAEDGSFLINGWSLQTVPYRVERRELFIFGSDFKLKSSIPLPIEVITLFDSAMINTNEILVSLQKESGVNLIQKLDEKGNVLKEIENVSSFILTDDNRIVVIDRTSAIVFDTNLNEQSRVDLGIADKSGKTAHIATSLMNGADGNIIVGFDVYHIDKANPDEVEIVDVELVSFSIDGNVNWRKVVAKESVSIRNSLVEYDGNYVISALKEHRGAENLYVIGAYSQDGKELGTKYIKGGLSTFNQLAVIGDKLFNASTQRKDDTFQRVLSQIPFEKIIH